VYKEQRIGKSRHKIENKIEIVKVPCHVNTSLIIRIQKQEKEVRSNAKNCKQNEEPCDRLEWAPCLIKNELRNWISFVEFDVVVGNDKAWQ